MTNIYFSTMSKERCLVCSSKRKPSEITDFRKGILTNGTAFKNKHRYGYIFGREQNIAFSVRFNCCYNFKIFFPYKIIEIK